MGSKRPTFHYPDVQAYFRQTNAILPPVLTGNFLVKTPTKSQVRPESRLQVSKLRPEGTASRPHLAKNGKQMRKLIRDVEGSLMSLLKWSLAFLVIAGIAALFGFGGIAEGATDIAQVLFFIFLVIFAILGVLGLFVFKKVT